ncbi:MAG: UvrD-helicase domain-containing protein, partial [bacterium]|nr:UvrD-helicase domain-containing protein [bacterium]
MSSLLKRVLDLSCNKFVEACAGAGKTFALSKRYCAILDEFTKPDKNRDTDNRPGVQNILVITFTKKATAEMSADIYKDLNTLLNRDEIESMKDQGIDLGKNIINAPDEDITWLRATFSQNSISTIDSFCTRILRENADILGIDPEFSLTEAAEYKRRFYSCLEDFLKQNSRDLNNDLKTILEKVSLSRIYSLFDRVHSSYQFLDDRFSDLESMSEDDIYNEWCRLYTPDFDNEKVLNEFNRISCFADSLVTDPDDSGIKWLRSLKTKLAGLPEDDPSKKTYVLTELIPMLFTKSGGYMSRIPGSKKKWDNDEEITEYKNSVTALIDYLREPLPVYIVLQTPNKYDRISIAVIKSLISLYREFSTELSTIQKTHNYLGFNDVIILAGKLLKENPAVRKRYSEKYKHIMIDEFQDTNYPRWDIIRLIASDENNRLRTSGLFIVGDKKQSVYRFNQADVEVVDTVKKEFDSVRDPGDDVFIDLNDNYRASGAYIDNVINPLFSEVFQIDEDHERKPYEAEFNPTHLAGKIKDRESISAKTKTTCSLRVSLIEKEDRDKNDIGALNTALAVKELLEWGDECGLTGMDQPVIGVLLRKFTNIQSYLKIFQKYGIPFEIVSGRNLFHQQETYDLFHLISVLNNPNDDLALLGLLRSPVFCIPDKKIHRIRKGLKINGASLYSLITRDPELRRISDKINIWRDAARLRPLDRLIEDIISSDHREFGYYSEAGGKQKIANIDKLIGIIHSVSSKGSSLRDVCEYFRYNISNNPDTAQAGSKNNAPVQILTIHKSKGLEFPAVVIPELNTSGSGQGPVLPFGKINDHRTDEEHFECSISLTGDDDQKLGQGIINGLRYYEELRDEAEDKRLFYVAITRAKYRA